MALLTTVIIIASFVYTIFFLPSKAFSYDEKFRTSALRAGGIVLTLLFLWLVGFRPVFLSTALLCLVYCAAILHFNNFNPEVVKHTNKQINNELERLNYEQEVALKQQAHYLEEKDKYDSLNEKISSTAVELEQRQSELIEKESLVNKVQADLDKKINEELGKKEIELEAKYARNYKDKTSAFISEMKQEVEDQLHKEKEGIINDVFSFDDATPNSAFEIKQRQDQLNKKQDSLSKQSFLNEIDQKINQASNYSMDAKKTQLEIKSENLDLKTDINQLDYSLNNKIKDEIRARQSGEQSLDHKLTLEGLKRENDKKEIGYKLSELKTIFSSQLKEIELNTQKAMQEVSSKVSQLKLDMGQEILRLDSQQGKIMIELEKYYQKNQKYINQIEKVKLEAIKNNIEGQELLAKVQLMHEKHKLGNQALEQRLSVSLDKLSVKEGHLANQIGESMLKIQSASQLQHIALKDLALEKKDINILHREKNIEHKMNIQNVQHAKQDLQRARKQFQDKKEHVLENAKLSHQLYMKEQHYTDALMRERHSKGFLSQLAAHIESSRR